MYSLKLRLNNFIIFIANGKSFYQAWREARKVSEKAGKMFAENNFLSVDTLEMICSLKEHYLELLCSIGFVPAKLSRVVGFKTIRGKIDQIISMSGPKVSSSLQYFHSKQTLIFYLFIFR